MEIMVDKHGYIEEVVKVVESVVRRYYEKKSVEGALTGVLIAKKLKTKKGPLKALF